jgi:zinc/manganese transport system substrate-binding protein
MLPSPFDQPYLVRALLELALLAPIAGALGVFAILRRQVFTAHAVGVGALPGVVLAAAAGVSAIAGGLIAGIAFAAAALALGADRRRGDPAAVTGVLLAGAVGIGALLVSAGVGPSGARIDGLLFGSLLGITGADIARTAAVAAVIVIVLAGLHRPLALIAFDRDAARVAGLRIGVYDLLLAALIAAVVVIAVEAIGALLASALVILPAAAALRLTRRIVPALLLAALLALLAGVVGVLVADRLAVPPGAAVVLAAAALWPIAAGVSVLRRGPARRTAAFAGLLAALTLTAACGGTTEEPAQSPPTTTAAAATEPAAETPAAEPVRVVATTPIVADWARQVGGDDVAVETLLPAGADTHDYEPTPEAARAIADADLVLSSGAGLDEWADQLVAGAGGDTRLVELAPEDDLIATADAHADAHADEHDHEHGDAHADEAATEAGHDHGDVDPHYWHDPALAAEAVASIAAALGEADPARAGVFADRAAAYAAQIEALDAELADAIGSVPAERRRIATDHDAFGYLGRHYGIDIIGTAIPSTSGAASADAQTLAELIDLIRAEGVVAVFAESTSDPAVAEILADETGARLIHGLYGDTLGPEGEATGTYLGMMRGNMLLIVEGLRE